MTDREYKKSFLPKGAIRTYLFLLFFHLLPVPWFFWVVAGLAPPVVFLAVGLRSLFVTESGALGFGSLLVLLAAGGGLACYLLAWLLTAAMVRIRPLMIRTASLIALLAVAFLAAVNPIYVYGGHSGSAALSLFDFIDLLADLRLPAGYAVAYFGLLAVLLLSFLVYQHWATHRTARRLADTWQRTRRPRRYVLVAASLALLILFGWTHRMLLVFKPLAHLGLAAAQYRLALAIMAQPGAEFQGDASHIDLLEEASRQGHAEAALLLVKYAPTPEERRHWLTIAAETGHGEAQYRLYRSLIRGGPTDDDRIRARAWLEKAAANDFGDAQYALARYLIAGDQTLQIPKDVDKARRLWEAAAQHGHYAAMEELAWRYAKGSGGFPRDPQRAIVLYNRIADGYAEGRDGLRRNPAMAADRRARAKAIADTQALLAQGNPDAQARVARDLLRKDAARETIDEGMRLLEKAAGQGDPQLQYELGEIFLRGRHGFATDLPRGRAWWAKALAQNHVATMAQVAQAHQDGRFGYPVDLNKSKALVQRLIAAYAGGQYGVEPDSRRAHRWQNELKHLDRLIALAGGEYRSPDELRARAANQDPQGQYQLGRQMIVSGPQAHRRQGYQWIRRAAENGYAEAQYRLVTYYEREIGIMRNDPTQGVAFLRAAAEQGHLPAMGTLALAYEKGRYGLPRDFQKAVSWYQRLITAYESGNYQGEINDRFMPFNRSRLVYAQKALQVENERKRRYEEASPFERRIIAVEDAYRREYESAVNALDRRDGSPEGREKTRLEIQRLRAEYERRRDEEIARLRGGQ